MEHLINEPRWDRPSPPRSLAFDDYHDVVLHDIGAPINHVSGADDVSAARRLWRALRGRQEWKGEQKCQYSGDHWRIRDRLITRRDRAAMQRDWQVVRT